MKKNPLLTAPLGGVPPYIYGELGGTDRWVWFVLANLLALAAVCPFVGAISDMVGRRYVALTGATLICIGMIVCSTAHTMNTFIGKSSLVPSSFFITNLSSWYGYCWCRCRCQRIDSSRCHI